MLEYWNISNQRLPLKTEERDVGEWGIQDKVDYVIWYRKKSTRKFLTLGPEQWVRIVQILRADDIVGYLHSVNASHVQITHPYPHPLFAD